MTTSDAAVQPSLDQQLDAWGTHPLWRTLERFSPSQGWITYAILLAALLVVAQEVSRAEWTETPGLMQIAVWSSLTGLILAKTRIFWLLQHLLGLSVGFVVVIWQASSIVQGEPLPTQVQQVWSRSYAWYEAATSGGISTDLIPMSIGLLTLSWILGYLGSWFIFRRNNVWVAVVVGATALLTHLSFLPDTFSLAFFVFMFLAILLVARMSIVQRQQSWRRAGIGFTRTGGSATLTAIAILGVVVLVLAAVLPMEGLRLAGLSPGPGTTPRAPITGLEDGFARLFSGIASKKDLSGRFFGDTLPFIGGIKFGGEVVFWADTEYPSYWLNKTYSEYTSKGWIAGETTKLAVGPSSLPPPDEGLLKRVTVRQSLRLNFGTRALFSGGGLSWISRGRHCGDACTEGVRHRPGRPVRQRGAAARYSRAGPDAEDDADARSDRFHRVRDSEAASQRPGRDQAGVWKRRPGSPEAGPGDGAQEGLDNAGGRVLEIRGPGARGRGLLDGLVGLHGHGRRAQGRPDRLRRAAHRPLSAASVQLATACPRPGGRGRWRCGHPRWTRRRRSSST